MPLKAELNSKITLKTGLKVFSCFILYLMFWVLVTPITFLILRDTRLSIRLLFFIPLFVSILYFSGFLNFWIFLVPVICVETAFAIEQNDKLKKNTERQLFLLSVVALFHLSLLVFYELLLPEAYNLNLLDWFSKIDQFWSNLRLQVPNESKTYGWLEFSWFEYLGYASSVYFVSLIIGTFACIWRGVVKENYRNLDILFWLTIICFSLGFLNFEGVFSFLSLPGLYLELFNLNQIYFKNILIIFSSLYFFQGLSISSHLMEKLKITRFWQNLWYILIILNLPVILVLLGLVDFLFEFRSFKEKK